MDTEIAGSFAELLDRNFRHGTRAVARPGATPKPWGNKEVADALGKTSKTIQNWRRGISVPDDLAAIEGLLFGPGEDDAERMELRDAYALAQRRKGPKQLHDLPPRLTLFTGREEEIDRVAALLSMGSRAVLTGRAAVTGGGGVGKSSLAAEYAYRFGGRFAGVWWIRASNADSLMEDLSGLGESLGFGGRNDTDPADSARQALRRLGGTAEPWLLVYDSVERPADIREWLPSGSTKLIVTSRYPDWGAWAAEVPIDVWPLPDAIYYLQKRADRTDVAGATLLAEALGCLPLALEHAAAYCRNSPCTFADYAERAAVLIAVADENAPYPASVYATFNIALEEEQKKNSNVEALSAFLAFCAPDRIPLALIEGNDEDRVRGDASRRALVERSLASVDPFDDGELALRLHRLVIEVAADRSRKAGLDKEARHRLIKQMCKTYPDEGYSDARCWKRCSRLTPHALKALGDGVPKDGPSLRVIGRVGEYLNGQGHYAGAYRALSLALECAEANLKPDSPYLSKAHNNLALACQNLNKFDEAEQHLRTAVALDEAKYGASTPQAAGSLCNLGNLYAQQYRLVEARAILEDAVAKFRGAAPDFQEELATILSNLGVVLDNLSKLEAAEDVYRESLALREALWGTDDVRAASVINNLGRVLGDRLKFDEAEALLLRGIALCEAGYGPDHLGTANTLDNLGQIYHLQSRLDEAKGPFQRSLDIKRKILPSVDVGIAESLNNVAIIAEAQERWPEARDLYAQALAIYEEIYGPSHPHVAAPLSNLGDLLAKMDEVDEAERMLKRALAIMVAGLGENHPDTARIRVAHAKNLLRLGQHTAALEATRHAHRINSDRLGADHPYTQQSAKLEGQILAAMG